MRPTLSLDPEVEAGNMATALEGSTSRIFVTRVRAVDPDAPGIASEFRSKDTDRSDVPPGSVLLFDEAHDPIEPANHFLRSHCRVDKSIRTQNAYADDLAQWWTYIGRNGLAWNEIDLEQLEAYARYLTRTISPRTGRHYSHATVARRVVTVEMFYRWANERSLMDRPVLGIAPSQAPAHPASGPGGIAYAKRRPGRVKIPKQTPAHENVDAFEEHELRALLSVLGPDPLLPNPDAPIRNRLIAEVAVATGMRISEVCWLTTDKIEAASAVADISQPDDLLPLRLTKTKGGKKRVVYMRCDLWDAVRRYIKGERQAAIDCAMEGAVGTERRFVDAQSLFVNGATANKRDVGRPVTPDTVSRAFRKAVASCRHAKVVSTYVVDASTGKPMIDGSGQYVMRDRTVTTRSFHDLRHTFAVQNYRAAVKLKNPIPLKKLQVLLGHASMGTTMDVYLRHCDPDLVALEEAYSEKLRRIADAQD